MLIFKTCHANSTIVFFFFFFVRWAFFFFLFLQHIFNNNLYGNNTIYFSLHHSIFHFLIGDHHLIRFFFFRTESFCNIHSYPQMWTSSHKFWPSSPRIWNKWFDVDVCGSLDRCSNPIKRACNSPSSRKRLIHGRTPVPSFQVSRICWKTVPSHELVRG